MNEDQMRSFIDVVDTGSINKAARRQHLSVPSLAQRVTSLEHELGFELLERGPRGTVATEAGRCLYHAFAEALAIIDAAKERGRALAARRARLVSIGIWGRAAKFMTDAVEELTARDETLRVDFVSTSLMAAPKDFEDRAFDIFYSCRCTTLDAMGLEFVPLHKQQHVCVFAPGNPLERLETVSMDDLARTVVYAGADYREIPELQPYAAFFASDSVIKESIFPEKLLIDCLQNRAVAFYTLQTCARVCPPLSMRPMDWPPVVYGLYLRKNAGYAVRACVEALTAHGGKDAWGREGAAAS
ncbi:MAG: LysR family transcriptional regulator [Slackia sp.]|nr:LysR family transcriptional regulator [Slackia sp.]